jgi:hypothetical protein
MHVLNTAGVKVSVMEGLSNGKIHITVSEGQNSMASGSPRMDRTFLASTTIPGKPGTLGKPGMVVEAMPRVLGVV